MTTVPEDWTLQVSFKNAAQTMINVRGNTEEDLRSGIEAIQNIADMISATEALLGPLQPIGAKRAPAAAQQQGAVVAPPVGAGPAQGSAVAPNCNHNLPAKFVPGGTSRAGRPYRAFWACDQGQQNDCKFRLDA